MYPLYPFLGLNASISLHIIISYIVSDDKREFIGRIPLKLKLWLTGGTLLAAAGLSVLRTVGMISAYDAPLRILKPLQNLGVSQPEGTVCFGKEWYRFPSSFHLPNGMQGKFIKSEFKGLLPGEFARKEGDIFHGSSVIPTGMNDLNLEDPGKYVSSPLPPLNLL